MTATQARTLILLRHAKSAYPDGVPDHERPLSSRGRRDAPTAGRWMRISGYIPDHVLCSTARRARETWHLAERELGAQPLVRFNPDVYEASLVGLLELIRRLPAAASTVTVVGHDPAVPEMAVALTSGPAVPRSPAGVRAPATASERLRNKFPTAAIAVLDLSGPWSALSPGCARLATFVTPRDMEA